MKTHAMEDCTHTLGEGQGWKGLPVRDVTFEVGNGPRPGSRVIGMQSEWLPSKEELARLNAGAPIVVTLLCDTHPPITVDVAHELVSFEDRT